jgi:ferric-dicitrate binding protein FerR (iron transport regulator)
MDERERLLSARAEGLVELARNTLGRMTEERRLAGLEALRGRLSGRRSAWVTHRAAVALAGGLALAACIVLALSWGRPRGGGARALVLRVEGGDLRADGVVEGVGSARPVLRFSDGSEIALAARARARVGSMDEHGARVILERGEAHVYVEHEPGTHWTFDAGPYVVAVTGTAFALSWREDTQRLDVRLENGTVSVRGPVSDAPLTLRAGQWLTARGGDVRIRGLDAADDLDASAASLLVAPSADVPPDSAGTPWTSQSPTEPNVAAPGSGTGRGATGRPRDHDWAGDLTRGRPFKAIVDDAVALGVDGVFAQSGSSELAALADAARYTLRQDIARGALLAQRRRFSGSDHARAAAFDLGRIEEAGQNPRAALTWFDTYLAEAPNGRYASEALGRKMTLVKLFQGREAARSWADLYLRRFPSGTYADAARAVTSGGP